LGSIIIPVSVELLCESCFSSRKSPRSFTFERGSNLQRVEEQTFVDAYCELSSVMCTRFQHSPE
jgi:hypothetical protein